MEATDILLTGGTASMTLLILYGIAKLIHHIAFKSSCCGNTAELVLEGNGNTNTQHLVDEQTTLRR